MDSIDGFSRDRAGAEILRESLRALARQHDGTPVGERIQAVLAGRATMADLARDPAIRELAAAGLRRYETEWAQMGAAERQATEAEARRINEAFDDPPEGAGGSGAGDGPPP